MKQAGPIPMSSSWESGGISWLQRFPPEEKGFAAPHQAPHHGAPVLAAECENPWGFCPSKTEDHWNPRVLIKGPIHRLTHRNSPWVPAKGKQLQRHQRHTERNWIVWLQGEGHHCPCVEPSLKKAYRGGRCHIWICINLLNTLIPPKWLPEIPLHPTHTLPLAVFRGCASWTALACTTGFLISSTRSATPGQVQLVSMCPVPFAERPQAGCR